MTTTDQYKASRFLSLEIRNHINKWGAPLGFYKDFKRSNSIYSLKEPENVAFIDRLADVGLSYRDAFVDYLKEMESSIRSLRYEMKRTVSYKPVLDGVVDGQMNAKNIVRDVFPRSTVVVDENFDRVRRLFDEAIEIDSDYVLLTDPDGYYPRNYVNIKPFWQKLVHQRGIALAKSTEGVRLVLSATKLERQHLADKNITVFKVKAVGFKSKKAVMQDGFLAIYDYEENPDTFVLHNKQHVLHNTLSDAVSVLDRRIERAVFGAME